MCVRDARDGEVAWPIQWVFIARHHKHRWFPPRAPNIMNFHMCVQRFTNKLTWKMFFLSKPQPSCPRFAKYPRVLVRRTTDILNGPLKQWCARLSEAAMSATNGARRRALHQGESFTNITNLDRLGLAMLRRSEWVFVPRDRGCGYVAHCRSDMHRVHQSVLAGSEYVEVDPDLSIDKLKSHYVNLVDRAAKVFFDDSDVDRLSAVRQMNKSLSVGTQSSAKLLLTCKDQKYPTEQRNIHASSSPV
jgi:hypothetical protein